MISDALAKCISEMDHYLTDPAYKHIYRGRTSAHIWMLRNSMEDVCQELIGDEPPSAEVLRELENMAYDDM